MKKIVLFVTITALLLSLSACGVKDPTIITSSAPESKSSQSSSSSASSATKVEASSVDDNLKGLQKYLEGNGVVQGSSMDMDASFIGAKSGVKYRYSYEGKDNITVEIYEYATSGLNETATKIIDSVKKNGKFVIMDKDVNAVMSGSGKYLMIYADTATGDKNAAHKKEAEKLFKEFKS